MSKFHGVYGKQLSYRAEYNSRTVLLLCVCVDGCFEANHTRKNPWGNKKLHVF